MNKVVESHVMWLVSATETKCSACGRIFGEESSILDLAVHLENHKVGFEVKK